MKIIKKGAEISFSAPFFEVLVETVLKMECSHELA